jgi:hypothetical protein
LATDNIGLIFPVVLLNFSTKYKKKLGNNILWNKHNPLIQFQIRNITYTSCFTSVEFKNVYRALRALCVSQYESYYNKKNNSFLFKLERNLK